MVANIRKGNMDWPEEAATRLQRLMHKHDFYITENFQESEMCSFIRNLIVGTDLCLELNESQEANLRNRVAKAVQHYTTIFIEADFLEHLDNDLCDKGIPQKTQYFTDLWIDNKQYWQSSLRKPVDGQISKYDSRPTKKRKVICLHPEVVSEKYFDFLKRLDNAESSDEAQSAFMRSDTISRKVISPNRHLEPSPKSQIKQQLEQEKGTKEAEDLFVPSDSTSCFPISPSTTPGPFVQHRRSPSNSTLDCIVVDNLRGPEVPTIGSATSITKSKSKKLAGYPNKRPSEDWVVIGRKYPEDKTYATLSSQLSQQALHKSTTQYSYGKTYSDQISSGIQDSEMKAQDGRMETDSTVPALSSAYNSTPTVSPLASGECQTITSSCDAPLNSPSRISSSQAIQKYNATSQSQPLPRTPAWAAGRRAPALAKACVPPLRIDLPPTIMQALTEVAPPKNVGHQNVTILPISQSNTSNSLRLAHDICQTIERLVPSNLVQDQTAISPRGTGFMPRPVPPSDAPQTTSVPLATPLATSICRTPPPSFIQLEEHSLTPPYGDLVNPDLQDPNKPTSTPPVERVAASAEAITAVNPIESSGPNSLRLPLLNSPNDGFYFPHMAESAPFGAPEDESLPSFVKLVTMNGRDTPRIPPEPTKFNTQPIQPDLQFPGNSMAAETAKVEKARTLSLVEISSTAWVQNSRKPRDVTQSRAFPIKKHRPTSSFQDIISPAAEQEDLLSTAEHGSLRSPQQSNLQLIFQGLNKSLHFNYPHSSYLLFSTLKEFFTSYAEKSGVSLRKLESLTFDVRSADMAKMEVGLTANESSWRSIQEEYSGGD